MSRHVNDWEEVRPEVYGDMIKYIRTGAGRSNGRVSESYRKSLYLDTKSNTFFLASLLFASTGRETERIVAPVIPTPRGCWRSIIMGTSLNAFNMERIFIYLFFTRFGQKKKSKRSVICPVWPEHFPLLHYSIFVPLQFLSDLPTCSIHLHPGAKESIFIGIFEC